MPEHIEVEVLMLKGDKGDAGATEWGGIAGKISDNNELQAALDKKADVESLKTLAISGKFPDLLEKPTSLKGYGVEPQTAYGEIKDLVKPNFSSLQGSPTENYNLKRELDNKTNVAQFNNLNREVSILQSAVNSRATTTQVNELNNKVMSKADKSAISTINSTLSDKAERYEINNINNRLNAMLARLNAIEKASSNFPKRREIFLLVHPVGSIFVTVDSNFNPNDFFGGTWQRWGQGQVPVGVNERDNDFRYVEQTGGEKAHQLSIAEMPTHFHGVYPNNIQHFYAAYEGKPATAAATSYSGAASQATTVSGDSQPHNNLQPYITCFMWKRIY